MQLKLNRLLGDTRRASSSKAGSGGARDARSSSRLDFRETRKDSLILINRSKLTCGWPRGREERGAEGRVGVSKWGGGKRCRMVKRKGRSFGRKGDGGSGREGGRWSCGPYDLIRCPRKSRLRSDTAD